MQCVYVCVCVNMVTFHIVDMLPQIKIQTLGD